MQSMLYWGSPQVQKSSHVENYAVTSRQADFCMDCAQTLQFSNQVMSVWCVAYSYSECNTRPSWNLKNSLRVQLHFLHRNFSCHSISNLYFPIWLAAAKDSSTGEPLLSWTSLYNIQSRTALVDFFRTPWYWQNFQSSQQNKSSFTSFHKNPWGNILNVIHTLPDTEMVFNCVFISPTIILIQILFEKVCKLYFLWIDSLLQQPLSLPLCGGEYPGGCLVDPFPCSMVVGVDVHLEMRRVRYQWHH